MNVLDKVRRKMVRRGFMVRTVIEVKAI